MPSIQFSSGLLDSCRYGDFYPITYCGRIISVLSGLYGVFCTALLVALISRKLEFSRAEKAVYQFVSEVELKKRLHKAAANVIKQGWLIYRLKKPNHDSKATTLGKEAEIIRRQQKFLVNIQSVRKIQQEQRKNDDSAVTTLEIYRQQSEIANLTQRLFGICQSLEKKVSYIEDKMEMFDMNLRAIQDMVISSKNK
jgi:potassium intermediate/small conductance calcium-activated channel subfamily N protein 4